MLEVRQGLSLEEDAFSVLKYAIAGVTSRESALKKRVGFSPVFNGYYDATYKKSLALEQFILFFANDNPTLRPPWYSVEAEGISAVHSQTFQEIVTSCQKYIAVVDQLLSSNQLIIAQDTYKSITAFINKYSSCFKDQASKHPFVKNVLDYFDRYQKILNHFCEHRKMLCNIKELIQLTSNFHTNINLTSQNFNFVSPSEVTALLKHVSIAQEIMLVKTEIDSATQSTLHTIEIVLLEARRLMLIRPAVNVIRCYFEMNRNLINIQIRFLEYLRTISTNIDLWPVLNRDLERIQEKGKSFPALILQQQKKQDIKDFSDAFAEDITELVKVIFESESINNRFKNNERNLTDTLTALTHLRDTPAFAQSALIRFLVLTNIINCYCTKNSTEITMSPTNLAILYDDLEAQIGFLQNFANNLSDIKPIWNGRVFRFFNNFIFIKNNLHKMISSTELILLHCEIAFKYAALVDLEFKNRVIEMQIQLLQIQGTIMDFTFKECAEEFVRSFYFKSKDRDGFIYYDVITRNKELAEQGDRHNIIHGIPLEELIKVNKKRRLALEAISLERQAKQREPKDTDYYHAISSEDQERNLTQWEEEAAKIKARQQALEEKQQRIKNKQKQNFKKLADKRAQKSKLPTKSKEENKGEKPDGTMVLKAASKRVSDPLAIKLGELMLQLNPKQFCAETVKLVIIELYQLILNSSNKELVFNALSTIGDSYSMIAGHHLNRRKKHPEAMIVDLKLALNYYGRAELALRDLTDISIEEHLHYYTWLHHSICIQRQLLNQYVLKFTREHEELLASRETYKQENPQKWKSNHLNPQWHESKKAQHTKAIGKALEEANILKATCDQFSLRLEKKVYSSTGHMAYSFQHYLNHSGKRSLPKQQLCYELKAPEEFQSAVSDEGMLAITWEDDMLEKTDQDAPHHNTLSLPLSPSSLFAFDQFSTIPRSVFARTSADKQLMPPFTPHSQTQHSSSSAIAPCIKTPSVSKVTQQVDLPSSLRLRIAPPEQVYRT